MEGTKTIPFNSRLDIRTRRVRRLFMLLNEILLY